VTGAKAVVAISTHGNSPRILSTYRVNLPVMVACTRPGTYNRSTLYYSVHPLMVPGASDPEFMFKKMEGKLKTMGLVKAGDVLVFVFGYPIHGRNNTNSIRRWEVT
jgi:pyruvate kinase